MRQRPAGFTLIETATALAVVGILAGIGGPSMAALLERQRASAATSTLVAHMTLARTAAVTYRRRAVLCPSADARTCAAGTDWSSGWIVFLDPDGNQQPDEAADIVRGEQTPGSRHLRVVGTEGRSRLRYLPDGRSAGTNLTLSICGKRGQVLARVVVSNSGRPRSERPSRPSACPA